MTARVTYFDRAPAYVAPRHLPAGTGRSVEDRTPLPATLLVTISAE